MLEDRGLYIGWNWAGDNERKVKWILKFVDLDSKQLGYYWDEAWDCVRALLIMDALVDWVYGMMKSGKEHWEYESENPFNVGFEYNK